MTLDITYRDGEVLMEGDIFRSSNESMNYRWRVGKVYDNGFLYEELVTGGSGLSDSPSGRRLDWVLVSRKEAPKKTGFSQFITTNQL